MKTISTVLSFIFLYSALSSFAWAKKVELQDVIVTNTRDDLILFLKIDGAFEERMQKAVLSGVPTTFSFLIRLYRTRKMWIDKKIIDMKITHTIKYDSLKKEFMVIRSWRDEKPIITSSFKEAQKLMIEIDNLKIAKLDNLEKARQYQVRAKAKLSRLTPPFYLHYVLFFVSVWDFETAWFKYDFIF